MQRIPAANVAYRKNNLPRRANGSLVFPGSLCRGHVGSVGRLGGLVFASAPWRGVGFSERR